MNENLDNTARSVNTIISKLLNDRNITARLAAFLLYKEGLDSGLHPSNMETYEDGIRYIVRKELTESEEDLFDEIMNRLLSESRSKIAAYDDSRGKDNFDSKFN